MDQGDLIASMEAYFDRLWPLPRSLMGQGTRETLDILSEIIPIQRLKFESGSKIFDWIVPKEWVVKKAYFIDPKGNKHCDFSQNNLHLINCSQPYSGKVSFEELKKHLHTLPEKPEAIPYRISYYQKAWGFCLSHNEFQELPDGEYEVIIDTEFKDGFLEIGEAVLPGKSKREILFSSYVCHPSMANNELSGPLALSFLYQKVKAMDNRLFTYRFILNVETIGTLCFLQKRIDELKKNLMAGYVMTCVGDPGGFTYKTSRQKTALCDRVALRTLSKSQTKFSHVGFDPYDGSEERQYCAPGFDLPVGSLMRTMYGCYPQYHTSLDNKDFISFEALAETVEMYTCIVNEFETEKYLVNQYPNGEPQLQKWGLYPDDQDLKLREEKIKALFWTLNLTDGFHSITDIVEASGLSRQQILDMASLLQEKGILKGLS